MTDVRRVVAALRAIPQLASLDEQSLLLPQWTTLETVFSHLFRRSPALSDISAFIEQRQHDRSLERLHPTPASLALARDREALYRQLVAELVYGQLYGIGPGGEAGKRRAGGAGLAGAKAAAGGGVGTVGSLLGESGEAVRVLGDLVKRVLGGGVEEKEEDAADQRGKADRREHEDDAKAVRDERKHADYLSSTGSARKKATPSSPAPSDHDDRRPKTASVSADKRSADKVRAAAKPAQPAPAPKSAAARRRAEEERERELKEERDRQRHQEREEEEKMAEMREMMRQKAVKEAKRSEHTLRNKPLPNSPNSDLDHDDTDTTAATRRPLTAAARQPPVGTRGKAGSTASGEAVMLERQLREEKDKVAALERRVREMEALITDGSTKPVGEDGWRQQLLLHAQCEQWRRQCALLQGAVDGKRQVMDELRTLCEWMREGSKRLRRLEKAGTNGEEEARRLVGGVTAMVSELVAATDESMKRIESLDQHTNTLSTTASSATSAPSSADSSASLPAGVLSTLTSFASHLQVAHPLLMELQQAAHFAQLDRVAGSHGRRAETRAAEAAEQLTTLADESRKLGQLLLPYSQLAYSASSASSSTPLVSALSSSLTSTPLSSAERRELLAVVAEAERSYTTDLHTYSAHLTALYPLLSALLATSASLTTSLTPLLRQLAALAQSTPALASAATASSASKRIADVMRLVGERGQDWATMEGELRGAMEEMRRLMAEGRESIVEELSEHGGPRRRAEELDNALREDRVRDEVADDRRWRKPSKSAIEHDQHYTADGRLYNGRVQHDQEWQA